MKALCSQAVTSSHLCGVGLCQGTAQASAPQVPWCDLCVWRQQGIWKGMAWSKAIDLYAFSCSSFRKKARNLIETAQRKSQRVLSHGGLRKGNRDIAVITWRHRSPGIAARITVFLS